MNVYGSLAGPKTAPAQPTEDQPIPCERRAQYSQLNNVRAVPQIYEQDRDHFGPVPFVMLRGTWLRKFGFEVGVHLRIEAVHGQITIRPLWNDGPFSPQAAALNKPTVRYAEVGDR